MTPSVFYDPNDRADRDFRKLGGGSQPSPRMKRARSCATAAMLIRSTTVSEPQRLRKMKAHIMGLRLSPSRLTALWSCARDEALFYAAPEKAAIQPTASPGGGSMVDYSNGAWLVMRAALALLLRVPLENDCDAEAFTDIVTTAGYVLPKRDRRRAIAIARRYVSCAIEGKPFAQGGVQ